MRKNSVTNKEEHVFKLKTAWHGGRNEVGKIECGNLKTEVSVPRGMSGPGIGTNPDEMLLGAAATCYLISLATMLEYSKINAHLDLQSEGIVQVEKGIFTYKQISHNITIFLQEPTEKTERLAKRLAIKAECSCMISKAIKGNVEVVINCIIKSSVERLTHLESGEVNGSN